MITALRRPLPGAIALFLLAALPRLFYMLVVQGYDYHPVEMEYGAMGIVQHGTLCNCFAGDSGPSAHVAPGYAYLLAGCFWLFGVQTYAGWCAQVVLAVTVSSLGIALLPAAARRLELSSSAAVVAAVLLALSPFNLWMESRGAWEQPFAAFALMALLVCFHHLHSHGWQPLWHAGAGGALVGLSALFSPIVLPVVAIILTAEVVQAGGKWRQRIYPVAAHLAVAFLVVAPWLYRNYVVLGGLVPIRSNFSLELNCGNHDAATGKTFDPNVEGLDGLPMHPDRTLVARTRLREIGELAYMREMQQQAFGWIANHPARFAELTLIRIRYFWFPPTLLTSSSSLGNLKAVFYGLLSLGSLGWLTLQFLRRTPLRWHYLAVLVAPSLPYLLTHVDLRYRHPLVWVSALFSCQFVAAVAPQLRARSMTVIRASIAVWAR